jgi:hypothetical protein
MERLLAFLRATVLQANVNYHRAQNRLKAAAPEAITHLLHLRH